MMFDSIKIIMQTSLILIYLLFLYTSCTQNSEELNSSNEKYSEVSLISTEKRTLHSKIVDQDFEIYISLPYK